MQANQSQLIKLWPLCPHQTTRMNLQKTKKSGKIETKWWYSKNLETYLHVLLYNCLVPGCCTFSRLRNLLPKPFSVHQSSPSLYVFQVPLFYASFQTILLCTFSYDPLMHPFRRSSHAPFQTILSCPPSFPFPLIFVSASRTKYGKENPLSFLLFSFLFRKSECSFRISYFHMYAATLIPFSLSKYFSYVFECTYLSEIWIVALILLPNKKNENRENKNKKS